jgi:dihydroorotate dehydrogenase electron transfer subunit
MKLEQARVVGHTERPGDYRVLDLECPPIATAVAPGQFVHLQVPSLPEAVLRRPFSVFRAWGKRLALLYKRVGRGTEAMTRLVPGDAVSLLGPLGNAFPRPAADAWPVVVAGGYGAAPLCFLAQRMRRRGTAFIGAATAAEVVGAGEFRRRGWELRIATEDGSLGRRGLVTEALDAWIAAGRRQRGRPPARGAAPGVEFFACGPDGMLRAVAERAARMGCGAWLSLDRHMGCGVGACLACVLRVRRDDGKATWARVCRDGPVFEARRIVWE